MTLDLAALEALIAKATPWPWECDDKQAGDAYRYILGRASLIARIPAFAGGEDDAALIVAAVNALPELIARVREAEAAALAMRERCAHVCNEIADIHPEARTVATICAAAIRAMET